MSHVKRTWVQENVWTCSSCKSKNFGHAMTCTNCGSPREKNELDIIAAPDPTKAVTDKKMLAEAALGANWVCTFCGGQARDDGGNCKVCAAAKDEGANKRRSPKPTVVLPDFDRQVPANKRVVETGQGKMLVDRRPPPAEERVPDLRRKIPWLLWLAGTLGAAALLSLLIWLLVPHQKHAKVQSTHWTHTVKIRQRTTVHDNGWGSPAGAFNVSCDRRKKGTENCHAHDCRPHTVRYESGSHECNCRQSCSGGKNGYSSCSEVCDDCPDYSTRTEYDTCYDQCDVYDDWCEYDEYKWPVVATPTHEGDDQSCTWPSVAITDTQRAEQVASYDVVFAYDDKTATYHPSSVDDYRRFTVGVPWLIKVNIARMVYPQSVEGTQ